MNHRPGSARAAASRDHWDTVYTGRDEQQVSWYQADPRPSVELIEAAAGEQASGPGGGRNDAVIDVGGGMSHLGPRLIDDGFTDVTVLDVSPIALATARRRPGGDRITWIQADVLTWRPARPYRVWHDRAVFHFLTDPAGRTAYLATLRAALASGGAIVLGTFAPDGPTHCSGLPVARYSATDLAARLADVFGDAVTVTGDRAEAHHTPAGVVQPFTWITARLT